MASRVFWAHGELCAAHPWEVIVATLTLTACMLTVERQQHVSPPKPAAMTNCNGCLNEVEYNAADVIVMTLIRCLAVLYSYYQFCNLQRLGSKYILGIAGLFTVFSSFVFTSTVLNFLRIDVSDLKDALFFFLLLIDLSKAAILAEFALSASSQDEVKMNIARGMSLLGPTITLDTLVETLLLGVGTLSGVHRLEMLSYFACLSVIVNYAVFMTFYPACLSLILELSRIANMCGHQCNVRSSLISSALLNDEDQKSNPVVQRVKLIMSVGLMLVHAHSWWPLRESADRLPQLSDQLLLSHNRTEDTAVYSYIMRWMALSADHIVILILLLALLVKFIFFEKEEFELRLRMSEDKAIQADVIATDVGDEGARSPMRALDECEMVYRVSGANSLTDDEIVMLVSNKTIAGAALEKAVGTYERGVRIRRKVIGRTGGIMDAIADLPYKNYNYRTVMGACCENVIGYMQIPVGVAGPLRLDDERIFVPMATTEGCLVASTSRGCKALHDCGVTSRIISDGMTRAPVLRFPSAAQACDAVHWLQSPQHYSIVKAHFDSSSRFARLEKLHARIFGRLVYIRFVATTGDAMGMNMVSKGTEIALSYMRQTYFPDMEVLSISGNFCTDKKPSAVNWIEGRGKYVVCEATVPAAVVHTILKTSARRMVDANISKNLIGSAAAGSIGGNNAHAANVITAIYIATGQDPAQNVGSSNCMTLMEVCGSDNQDLYISCTMPSIEVGTVGGGTILQPQAACLDMLGAKGSHPMKPGANANRLARIVCAAVLAGELSLMAALSAGHLVQSHLRHNRSAPAASAAGNKGSSSSSFNSSQ